MSYGVGNDHRRCPIRAIQPLRDLNWSGHYRSISLALCQCAKNASEQLIESVACSPKCSPLLGTWLNGNGSRSERERAKQGSEGSSLPSPGTYFLLLDLMQGARYDVALIPDQRFQRRFRHVSIFGSSYCRVSCDNGDHNQHFACVGRERPEV
jgi:hypothetical protein